MLNYDTVIVGGGAAGICAAIAKARHGKSVVICEKTGRIGKKLLATGNGRCNLLNDDLSAEHYNPAARSLVQSVFDRFGKPEIITFFKGLGLETYSDGGRIFPRTNQAASVLTVLEMELQRLAVPVEFLYNFSGISFSGTGITVTSGTGKLINCKNIIITGGGKTYPLTGSDGGIYDTARKLGHTVVDPVPAAVPLVVDDPLCRQLPGQRVFARAWSVIDSTPGEAVSGDLLFTKYGLSGTCVLDISEAVSLALHRYHETNVSVAVDMVPFLNEPQLREELELRVKRKTPASMMMAGILPDKFSGALKDLFTANDIPATVALLKNRRFKVSATRGWDEAEFTAGGIALTGIKSGTLESTLHKGVYFAGEVLDVNGARGGYNLAWAWASGFTAGLTL